MRCAAEPAERFPSGSLRHRSFGGRTALGIPDSLGLTLSRRRGRRPGRSILCQNAAYTQPTSVWRVAA